VEEEDNLTGGSKEGLFSTQKSLLASWLIRKKKKSINKTQMLTWSRSSSEAIHQGLPCARVPRCPAESLSTDLRQPLRRSRHVSPSFQLILGFCPKTSLKRIINSNYRAWFFKRSTQASIFIKLDLLNAEIKK